MPKTKNLPNTPSEVPAPSPVRRKVVLRVNVLMAEHGYRFAGDLWKALRELEVDISYSQLTRVINNSQKALNVELLEGLATLFNCQISELFKDT